MTGSLSAVLTMGLGSWGSPSLIVTLGYGTEAPAETGVPIPVWRARHRPETMRSTRPDVARARHRPDTARSRER
jgi:hypothetical protein